MLNNPKAIFKVLNLKNLILLRIIKICIANLLVLYNFNNHIIGHIFQIV
jgi:hypothetical protein